MFGRRKRLFLLLSCVLSAVFAAGSSADIITGWSAPVPVTAVNSSSAEEWSPYLSFDGLSLYFARVHSSTSYNGQIYVATRASTSAPFGAPVQLSGLNEPGVDVWSPWVSADNLRMYYSVENNNFPDSWDIKYTQRASVDDPWTVGSQVSELNALGSLVGWPKLTEDELTMVFSVRDKPGGTGSDDLWIATRPSIDSPFTDMRQLTELNTPVHDLSPYISPDGLDIYFMSNRNGPEELFAASRDSLNDAFGNVVHLSLFDTPGGSSHFPSLSSDGTEFYFMRATGGASTRDIYVSYIPEPTTMALLGIGGFFLRRRRPLS